jgi:hypothetical protein
LSCTRSQLLAAVLLTVGIAAPSRGEPPELPTANATWTDAGPEIDGVLDDPVWADAEVMGPLTQVEPVEGAGMSLRTEVRILTDEDNLYIGVRCYDDDPDSIIARNMLRDGTLLAEDRVGFVLDTFHDRRNGYFFETNPLGLRLDGLIEDARFSFNWDGIWNVKTIIDEKGWTAEFVIPFKTLNFREGEDRWGMNFLRGIRGSQENGRWASPFQNRSFVDMSGNGVLHGLGRARQGLGLDIVPSMTIRRVDDSNELPDESGERHYTRITPSGDVRYKITPSLTATATANTDFGQTPVDDVQVNLSQFALFFPEKREFFLQDQGIFDFGNIQVDAQPFFSRRIGLSEFGDPVPIRGGGKLTGRSGPINMGFLGVHQKSQNHVGSEDDVDARTLGVARVKMNVLEESTVGLIATYGDPQSDDGNWLVGADANYRTSKLFGDKVFQAHAFFQHSHTTGAGATCERDNNQGERDCDSEAAYGLRLVYPNDRINWEFIFHDIQEDFNPALGFVRRGNAKRYRGFFRYRWRPETWIKTIDNNSFGAILTESDRPERITEVFFRETFAQVETLVGDMAGAYYQLQMQREQDSRRVFDNFSLENGKYWFSTGGLFVEATKSRELSGRLEVFGGEWYDGYRVGVLPRVEWRPTRQLLFALSYSHTRHWGLDRLGASSSLCNVDSDVDPAPCGNSFTVRIATARFELQLSPDISWNNLVQYDNGSDEINVQSRFRWTITPGSDLFLILNQGFIDEGNSFDAGRTEPLVKLAWTFRF